MQCLLAVLLLVRSRPGPQLVFRYPSDAKRPSTRPHRHGHNDSDSDSDSDGDVNGLTSLRRSRKAKPSEGSAQMTVHPDETAPDADHFLGYSEDSLEKLLAPGVWSDRTRFEVCLDGLTFVGHPIHAHEDGRWTRKEVRGPREIGSAEFEKDDRYGDYTNFGITVTEPLSPVVSVPTRTARESAHEMPASFDSQIGRSLGTSMQSGSSTSTTTVEQLSMFNVVLVFDTSRSGKEDAAALDDVYRHVIKKLSKALHYCQKQSSFVGTETRRLLALYARAKQDRTPAAILQQQILESSELAWALKEVHDGVSTGAIANIHLNGHPISLHIPPRNPKTSPTDDLSTVALAPSAGLLLLTDKAALLRELAHPDTSPLAHFIRDHTPTKPLSKLAARLTLPLDATLHLARHLVVWRHARAIRPLHPRNVYVVAASAPTDRLAECAREYARLFPGLPSLPQMLKFLSPGGSGRPPVRYGMLMPSRDHRAPYMEILAWLVRGGWVVQMCTYGWLRRVPARARNGGKEREGGKAEVNANRRPLSVASLLSPQLRAVDDEDRASVSSERTAIPLSGDLRSKSPLPRSTSAIGDDETHEDDNGESEPWDIVVDPISHALSAEDVKALANLRAAVDDLDKDLAAHLPSLLQYFDGSHALEGIAAKEGLKRSVVERWVDLLVSRGFLTTMRRL